jgi:hypothetical protein
MPGEAIFKGFIVGGRCYSWDDTHPCLSFAEGKPPMVVVAVQGASRLETVTTHQR